MTMMMMMIIFRHVLKIQDKGLSEHTGVSVIIMRTTAVYTGCYIIRGNKSLPMGDTDKSPSLTRLLGVSTPLPLPSFGLLAARPMTPSSKLPHGEDDDMLMLLLLLVRSLTHVVDDGATAVVVAAGHTDGRSALQPWVVASKASGTRRGPW